jgi:SP family xylose:H+ symportor-like MFS transporter
MDTDHDRNYRLRCLICLTLTHTLSSFIAGYQIGVFNTCQLNVASSLDWGDSTLAMISLNTAIMPIGAVLGSLLAGKLANKLGRRKGIVINILISLVGTCINLIPIDATFTLGRFLAGVTAGIGTSIPPVYGNLYIVNEISPRNIAGKLGTITQLQIATGIFVSYALGLPLPVSDLKEDPMNNWWMVMILFPVLICVIQGWLVLFKYKLDTPRWYMNKEKYDHAKQSLMQIYRDESWRYHYAELERGYGVSNIESPTEESSQIPYKPPTYRELLTWGKYIKPMIIGMGLSTIHQLSGVNVFVFYSSSIFIRAGADAKEVNYLTTVMGLFLVLATFIATGLIDSKIYTGSGRRILLMQGALGMGVCNMLLGIFIAYDIDPYLQLAVILIFMAFFQSSFGPILPVYISEIITDKGVSLMIANNWVFVAIIGATFPVLASPEVLGIHNVFYMLAGICGFGFLFVWIMCIETKGLKYEDVQKIMLK